MLTSVNLGILLLLLVGLFSGVQTVVAQEPAESDIDTAAETLTANQAAITQKKEEIAALDEKIKALQGQRDSTRAEANLVQHQLDRLLQELVQAQLELKQTQLAIQVVDKEQRTTVSAIDELTRELEEARGELKDLMRLMYEHEQEPLIRIFLTSSSLSDVLAEREAYMKVQAAHVAVMSGLRRREEDLSHQKRALEEREQELDRLHGLLSVQKRDLRVQQQTKDTALKTKRVQEQAVTKQLAEAKAAREEISRNVFTLKSAGVTLKLTEAQDMARFASKLTGVRAALLLGVLKVETNLGSNLGSGVFPEDMHPASREAFVRITARLGLDPQKAPISARPRNYSGWGGAMGPGQFMPETWERIEGRVADLMQKPIANPYELTDAFVATALFLADKGAANRAQEYEAVNRYLAGPNWQRFTWYGDRVLAVAEEYEKEGL